MPRPSSGMDVAGARQLRHAIEQQEHWNRAEAVRDGRQSRRDPNVAQLIEVVGAIRRYRSADGSVFEKRLRDGRWLVTAAASP
jgi:hypothetical protein